MLEAIEIAEPGLTAHVLIEPEEIFRVGAPSVKCIVEVVSAGFVGVNRSVFFDFEDLTRFMAEAAHLLSAHAGAATLETMSPGELKVVVRPFDQAGHLQANVTMIKLSADGHRHRLETSFEVDRHSLSEALVELKALLK